MCGILGLFHRSGRTARREELQHGLGLLAHRGPDTQRVISDGPVALGHTRLSILDPTDTGARPMSLGEGRLLLTFDGAIYNFLELRGELEQKGHRFRGRSDTEVLLRGYEQWARCPRPDPGNVRIRSVGSRSEPSRRRERSPRTEISLLLLEPGDLRSRLRDQVASRSRRHLSGAGRRSPRRLLAPPVHRWRENRLPIDPTSAPGDSSRRVRGAVRKTTYWNLSFTKRADLAEGEAIELVQHRVAKRSPCVFAPTWTFGAFLSGGVDSSIVVALASETRSDLPTFTVSFDDSAFDESPFAAEVARHFGTRHQALRVTPDPSILERIVWHHGEPFADPSAVPSFCVSRFAAGEVRVALTGDGGDEFFSGYQRYRNADRIASLGRLPLGFRALVAKLTSYLETLLAEQKAAGMHVGHALWTLVQLELWFQTWIDGPSLPSPPRQEPQLALVQ